jgi:FixJ family two-component response regulator
MIVIVDDDDAVRSAIDRLLRSMGHQVATFATAEDFLNSKRISETSCLITDVQMPGMSGIDLLARLKEGGHHIPVIVISAFPDDHVRDRAIQLGACAFLRKPFGQAVLTDCLVKAINKH